MKTFSFLVGLEEQIEDSLQQKALFAAKFDAELSLALFTKYSLLFWDEFDKKDNPEYLAKGRPLTFPRGSSSFRVEVTPSIVYWLIYRTSDNTITAFSSNNSLPLGMMW